MTAEARLDAAEIALAHQGRTIEELSAEVRRQGAAIDALEAALRRLAERLGTFEDVATPAPETTRPPHW